MTPQPRNARPEGFIPSTLPLEKPTPVAGTGMADHIGGPSAERIELLETLLERAAEALSQYHDEEDYTEKELLADIDKAIGIDPRPCVCGGEWRVDPERPNVLLCACGGVYEIPPGDRLNWCYGCRSEHEGDDCG